MGSINLFKIEDAKKEEFLQILNLKFNRQKNNFYRKR